MENPNTWGEAETIVYETLLAIHNDNLEEVTVGTSPARRVTDALRAAGLLVDKPEEVKPLPRGPMGGD